MDAQTAMLVADKIDQTHNYEAATPVATSWISPRLRQANELNELAKAELAEEAATRPLRLGEHRTWQCATKGKHKRRNSGWYCPGHLLDMAERTRQDFISLAKSGSMVGAIDCNPIGEGGIKVIWQGIARQLHDNYRADITSSTVLSGATAFTPNSAFIDQVNEIVPAAANIMPECYYYRTRECVAGQYHYCTHFIMSSMLDPGWSHGYIIYVRQDEQDPARCIVDSTLVDWAKA